MVIKSSKAALLSTLMIVQLIIIPVWASKLVFTALVLLLLSDGLRLLA